MIGFLKVFGKGVLYTVLLPFILLIWALFTVYCILLFIYTLFKSIIIWIKGSSPFADTKEDIEAKRILLERQNKQQASEAQQTSDQYKDALIATLASAVAAQSQAANNNQQNPAIPTVEAYQPEAIELQDSEQIEEYTNEKGDDE